MPRAALRTVQLWELTNRSDGPVRRRGEAPSWARLRVQHRRVACVLVCHISVDLCIRLDRAAPCLQRTHTAREPGQAEPRQQSATGRIKARPSARAQARCSRRCSAAASSDPCILFVGPRERSDKAPDALTASSTPVRGAVSQPSRLLQVGRRAEDRDVASAHADWTVGVLY